MAIGPGENFTDIYKLNTIFDSQEECVAYISHPLTNRIIRDHLDTVFPKRPVEKVFCVRADRWEKYWQQRST